MGAPKRNQKGFRYRDSGGGRVQTGVGAYTVTGQDSRNDQVRVWGRWTDTGAGAIANVIGKGFTAAYTGVGIWTVTFTQGFQVLQMGSAFAMPETTGVGTDDIAQVGAFTAGVAGACTLVILNFTGAAAADPAAGDYVGFDVVLRSQWLD